MRRRGKRDRSCPGKWESMKKIIRKAVMAVRVWWAIVSRPIYVGKRLEANLRALTAVSIVCIVLGLVLAVVNIATSQDIMLLAAFFTSLAGAGCAYYAGVRKKREIAILFPTVFCAVMFTVYAVTGAGEGAAILWSLLLPIGMCYFVSVKYGTLLSAYHSLLFMLIFYTPLGQKTAMYYSDTFSARFPILFITLSVFTGMAMFQYHRNALLEIDYTEELNAEVARQTAVAEERSRRLEQMSFQTIQTLAHAIDAKDPYTRGHSTRVSQHAVMIAEELGWDRERVNDLRYAALLHDIGKIGVPDSILNKPTRLTDVEFGIIKSHTTMGGDILRDRTAIRAAEDVARSHHERYDGKGYPRGLRGEEITEEARIVAIADAFDAMRSNRIYRRACADDYIRRELKEGRGRQFDPHFTDVFLSLWDRGLLELEADEDNAEGGSLEASSALLKQVMESFAAQNAADDIDLTTGILRRAVGEAAIAKALQEESGCFALLDMDNLKKINDTYGHPAGDRALKLVGDTLAANSENGICCRLGGDEFVLLMKSVTQEEAEARLRRIIDGFAAKKDADVEITDASLSAGAVMCTPADTYAAVFSKADKALYHVKQNGKNGCDFYREEAEAAGNEKIDTDRLVSGLKNSGSYRGALDVEYRQFTKLYEYVTNLERRFAHPFKLVLIELEAAEGAGEQPEALEKAMYYMDRSIRQTIRNVDVVTRYSKRQYLVILVGADLEGVNIVVDRIFRGYYKMSGSGVYSPFYMIIPEAHDEADSRSET